MKHVRTTYTITVKSLYLLPHIIIPSPITYNHSQSRLNHSPTTTRQPLANHSPTTTRQPLANHSPTTHNHSHFILSLSIYLSLPHIQSHLQLIPCPIPYPIPYFISNPYLILYPIHPLFLIFSLSFSIYLSLPSITPKPNA